MKTNLFKVGSGWQLEVWAGSVLKLNEWFSSKARAEAKAAEVAA